MIYSGLIAKSLDLSHECRPPITHGLAISSRNIAQLERQSNKFKSASSVNCSRKSTWNTKPGISSIPLNDFLNVTAYNDYSFQLGTIIKRFLRKGGKGILYMMISERRFSLTL